MNLKEYLIKNKISNSEFSRITNIHRSCFSNYFSGKMIFGRKRAKIICDATKGKVSIEEIMFPKDLNV